MVNTDNKKGKETKKNMTRSSRGLARKAKFYMHYDEDLGRGYLGRSKRNHGWRIIHQRFSSKKLYGFRQGGCAIIRTTCQNIGNHEPSIIEPLTYHTPEYESSMAKQQRFPKNTHTLGKNR